MCKCSSAGPPRNRHAERLGQAAPWHPSWTARRGHLQEGWRDRGRLSSPHCPSGRRPVHPAWCSPGSGWDPHASWACRPAHLALALATRGAEGPKTRRSLPSRKRQPGTPQKKTAFPSVSLQTSGRQGPSGGSLLSTQQGPSTPRTGELGANSCLLQAGPARSSLLAGPRLERETQKACGNDDVSAATFHFLYTVHVCLPIVSVKKPLWIKSTSKTSHMITTL